jgi:hypothetical protein
LVFHIAESLVRLPNNNLKLSLFPILKKAIERLENSSVIFSELLCRGVTKGSVSHSSDSSGG